MSAPRRVRIGIVVTRGHESIFLRCMGGIVNRFREGRFGVVLLCAASGVGAVQRTLQHPDITVTVLPEFSPGAVATIDAAASDVLYYWEIGSDVLSEDQAAVDEHVRFFAEADASSTG
jgi:protein O-GlcNAc transferase